MIKRLLSKALVVTVLALPAVALLAKTALAEDLEFTLHNQSSSNLTEFYVESTDESTWGTNILGEDVKPGESGTVTIADGKTVCSYDIRGVFADGSTFEETKLNLCELGSYTYKDK